MRNGLASPSFLLGHRKIIGIWVLAVALLGNIACQKETKKVTTTDQVGAFAGVPESLLLATTSKLNEVNERIYPQSISIAPESLMKAYIDNSVQELHDFLSLLQREENIEKLKELNYPHIKITESAVVYSMENEGLVHTIVRTELGKGFAGAFADLFKFDDKVHEFYSAFPSIDLQYGDSRPAEKKLRQSEFIAVIDKLLEKKQSYADFFDKQSIKRIVLDSIYVANTGYSFGLHISVEDFLAKDIDVTSLWHEEFSKIAGILSRRDILDLKAGSKKSTDFIEKQKLLIPLIEKLAVCGFKLGWGKGISVDESRQLLVVDPLTISQEKIDQLAIVACKQANLVLELKRLQAEVNTELEALSFVVQIDFSQFVGTEDEVAKKLKTYKHALSLLPEKKEALNNWRDIAKLWAKLGGISPKDIPTQIKFSQRFDVSYHGNELVLPLSKMQLERDSFPLNNVAMVNQLKQDLQSLSKDFNISIYKPEKIDLLEHIDSLRSLVAIAGEEPKLKTWLQSKKFRRSLALDRNTIGYPRYVLGFRLDSQEDKNNFGKKILDYIAVEEKISQALAEYNEFIKVGEIDPGFWPTENLSPTEFLEQALKNLDKNTIYRIRDGMSKINSFRCGKLTLDHIKPSSFEQVDTLSFLAKNVEVDRRLERMKKIIEKMKVLNSKDPELGLWTSCKIDVMAPFNMEIPKEKDFLELLGKLDDDNVREKLKRLLREKGYGNKDDKKIEIKFINSVYPLIGYSTGVIGIGWNKLSDMEALFLEIEKDLEPSQ